MGFISISKCKVVGFVYYDVAPAHLPYIYKPWVLTKTGLIYCFMINSHKGAKARSKGIKVEI